MRVHHLRSSADLLATAKPKAEPGRGVAHRGKPGRLPPGRDFFIVGTRPEGPAATMTKETDDLPALTNEVCGSKIDP